MATTVESLPPEILSSILALSLLERGVPQIRHSYAQLKAYCLVSPRFLDLSQDLLLASVYLYHEAVAAAFLVAAPADRHRVRELRVFGDLNWHGVENPTLHGVVRKCEGVRTVSLWFFEALDAAVLESPALANVESLRLSSRTTYPLQSSAPAFPFALTALTLDNFAYPAALLRALFTASRATLRHLDVSTYGGVCGSLDPGFICAFPLVAPLLRSLKLPPITNPDSLPLLRLLDSLEALHLGDRTPSVVLETLDSLPPAIRRSLKKLSVYFRGSEAAFGDFVDELLAALFSDLEIGNLRLEVSFGVTGGQSPEGLRCRLDAVDKCREKGVTLRILC